MFASALAADQTITALFPIPSFPLFPDEHSARGGACSRSYLEICCSLAGTAHRCKALYRILIESNISLQTKNLCCLSFSVTEKNNSRSFLVVQTLFERKFKKKQINPEKPSVMATVNSRELKLYCMKFYSYEVRMEKLRFIFAIFLNCLNELFFSYITVFFFYSRVVLVHIFHILKKSLLYRVHCIFIRVYIFNLLKIKIVRILNYFWRCLLSFVMCYVFSMITI